MFFEMGRTSTEMLLAHIQAICDDISKRKKISLLLREHTVKECLDEAKHSASFHEIDLAELSHYKELAHIGYWIAKLKPVSVASPLTASFLINQYIDFHNQRLFGRETKLLKLQNEANEPYKSTLGFCVNEHVALVLIWDACETHWEFESEKLADAAEKQLGQRRVKALRELFFTEIIAALRTSLRLHSYTPRAFATTVEILLSNNLSPLASLVDE